MTATTERPVTEATVEMPRGFGLRFDQVVVQLDGRHDTAILDMSEVHELWWLLRRLTEAAANEGDQPCPSWCVAHPDHDLSVGPDVGCSSAEFDEDGVWQSGVGLTREPVQIAHRGRGGKPGSDVQVSASFLEVYLTRDEPRAASVVNLHKNGWIGVVLNVEQAAALVGRLKAMNLADTRCGS